MKAVSKTLYFGADRAERRRIMRALVPLQEARSHGADEATRLRLADPEWKPWLRPNGQNEGLAKEMAMGPQMPTTLLACGVCGRPTPQCICIDSNGKPLDWSVA